MLARQLVVIEGRYSCIALPYIIAITCTCEYLTVQGCISIVYIYSFITSISLCIFSDSLLYMYIMYMYMYTCSSSFVSVV